MRYTIVMKKSEQALTHLQEKGYKRTKNREAILEIVYSVEKPISANDILEKLAQKGLTPNKTTVYRKLDMLKAEGLVHEVMINSTTTFYERSDMNHHHHIICLNCKKVIDFHPSADVEQTVMDLQESIAKKEKCNIVRHSLEFFGYCQKCSTSV